MLIQRCNYETRFQVTGEECGVLKYEGKYGFGYKPIGVLPLFKTVSYKTNKSNCFDALYGDWLRQSGNLPVEVRAVSGN